MSRGRVQRPLSLRMFHILLALADGPINGYQLSLRVHDNSRGRVTLRPATQYENLYRLAEQKLVEETDECNERRDGRNQRFWVLTPAGEERLRDAIANMAADLEIAAAKVEVPK